MVVSDAGSVGHVGDAASVGPEESQHVHDRINIRLIRRLHFETIYRPIVNHWELYDNSENSPVLIDKGDNP